MEKAYRDARVAYDLRSDVMHGSRSQDDDHLLINAGLVHDLTREAMIGALAMHHLLGKVIGDMRNQSIARFYDTSAIRHELLFKRLLAEFRRRRSPKTVSP